MKTLDHQHEYKLKGITAEANFYECDCGMKMKSSNTGVISEILLKHRSEAIQISEGKLKGKDIGTSAAEAKADLKQLMKDTVAKAFPNVLTDHDAATLIMINKLIEAL